MLELALHTLLAAHAPLVARVGTRIALAELPEGSAFPAVVYQVVSDTPPLRLCGQSTAGMARVQVNPLAVDAEDVGELQALVLAALLSDASRTVASVHVRSARLVGRGPWSHDQSTGAWTRPFDLQVFYQMS